MSRFDFLKASRDSLRRRRSEARRRGHRPDLRLEGLEGRLLLNATPTNYYVTTGSGAPTVPGSLPYEVALANANTNPLGSVIRFTYPFAVEPTITLDQTVALSETSGPEVIVGESGLFQVSGNHQVEDFSIGPKTTAKIYDLIIADGSATTGGGIGNQGNLTLDDCTITGNTASDSGGGIENRGSLSVGDCWILNNTATNRYGDDYGGGIDSTGPLTITSSTLRANATNLGHGGGLYIQGTYTISDCTITGNSSGVGGGLFSTGGTATLTGCTISGNSATWEGGGLEQSNGSMTITGSTIASNRAEYGGGVGDYLGQFWTGSQLTLNQCTVAGNAAADGAGIWDSSANLTINASTISGNTAASIPNVTTGMGGGLEIRHSIGVNTIAQVRVTDSTFANNTAVQGGGIYDLQDAVLYALSDTIADNAATAAGGGGGLVVVTPSYPLSALGDTIVALNTAGSTRAASDIVGDVNAAYPDDYNLIGVMNYSQVGVNPLLAALGNYGGPTQTMALLPGSPAIAAGSSSLYGVEPTFDQRGVERASWGFDIGAFESQGFTLTVVAGDSPQSAPITSAFSEPLAVKVTARDPVEPVAGGTISFAAPASGASAKLSAGTATIGSTGVASVTATANAVPGSYSVTAAGVLYSAAQFQLTNQAPAPNPDAMTSSNWSGYVAATNLSQPQANSVTEVTGSWIVPTVTGPSTGTTYSAVWVGIDGFRDNTVEQLGTGQDVSNGQAVYYAWWEMYSSGLGQPEQRITSMTVEPGDSITASVQYMTSGAYQGQFHLSIVDSSRPNDSFSLYASSAQYQSPAAQRSCAEWIVEAPSVGGSIAALANFGNVTFTNASAVINGISGPINDSQWQSSAIDIGPSGARQDVTSVLTNSGTTFVVTYNTSAGAAALANANAVLGTAPGGARRTTRLSPPQSKKWIPHGRQASAWTSASSRLRFSTLIDRPNAVGSTLPGIGKDA